MKELSERTKREMIAGKRARIRWCLREGTPLNDVFHELKRFDSRVDVLSITDELITLKVTSNVNSKGVVLSEPFSLDFPSDTLMAQIMMVAG